MAADIVPLFATVGAAPAANPVAVPELIVAAVPVPVTPF